MKLTKDSIVVTGLGLKTPLGLSVDSNWEAMLASRSGISRAESFDPEGLKCEIVGEVKNFDPFTNIPKKAARRMARVSQLAVSAAIDAVEDAGLNLDNEDKSRIGSMISSGGGDHHSLEQGYVDFRTKGPSSVNPLSVPKLIPNMPSSNASIVLGLNGPNVGIVSACATGAHSVGIGMMTIRAGMADVMLVGGTESCMTKLVMSAYAAMGVFSNRNGEPERASRPFDKDRDGFVMGEGAGVLVIEKWSHAQKRGAVPLAVLSGFGMTTDAHSIAAPHPEGIWAARAMELAIKDADLSPEDIDYINPHGTSTLLNDKIETKAIKSVLGQAYGAKVPVSSTKSMIGHGLGAAGGIEAVVSVLAISKGVIPPNINYDTPDPECDLNIVGNLPREAEIRAVMSNSFGFGGHNAVLIFEKP